MDWFGVRDERPEPSLSPRSRRAFLWGAAATAIPGALIGREVFAQPAIGTWSGFDPGTICRPRLIRAAETYRLPQPTPLKVAWNANAVCLSPVVYAAKTGIFERYNLDVELVNFAGSTDQLLEAIATGKADAGVGMIFRWLKALEQGFDVKLIAGTHGGCMRMVGSRKAGVTDLASIKGKTIAISDMASPAKNAFSIMLQESGIDPNVDVEWRNFPAQLLGVAVQKGEAQVIADGDPNLFLIEKQAGGDFVEILDNVSGPYAHKTCCVVGVRGELVRGRREVAGALARALIDASDATTKDPAATAAVFAPYTPASAEDIEAILRTLTYHAHPVGGDLKEQIAFYTNQLKRVGIIKPSTDPAKFADHIYQDVLT